MPSALLDRSRVKPDHATMPGLIVALSAAMDLVDPALAYHHKRVGALAGNLALALGLTPRMAAHATLAGMLHDIGYLGRNRADRSAAGRPTDRSARIGGRILSIAGFARHLAAPVAHHHLVWQRVKTVDGLSHDDAILAQIVHLADLIDRMLDRVKPIHSQARQAREHVAPLDDDMLAPAVKAAFLRASDTDAFWLEASAIDLDRRLERLSAAGNGFELSAADLTEFGRLYSILVDARSVFTATHSWGVAAVVEAMGRRAGLPHETVVALELAGQLHDVGKLAIDLDILEKPGPLTPDEFAAMRAHTYYTEVLLRRVPGFDDLAEWAGDHHERLDGKGYPRRRLGAELPLAARLLTVADRYVAITEDRPYRDAFAPGEAIDLIERDAAQGAIDARFAGLLRDDLDAIDGIRREAQLEERRFVADILADE
jgi:HD-GYP domain-containing protein (c-di-GMP phosphodiesterase class II)